VVAIETHQRGVAATGHAGREAGKIFRPRSLVDHEYVAGRALLRERGPDRLFGLLDAVQREDHDIDIVGLSGRPRRTGNMLHQSP